MGLLQCGATEIDGVTGTTVDAGTEFHISTKAIVQNQTTEPRDYTITLLIGSLAIAEATTPVLGPGEDAGTDFRVEGMAPALQAGSYDIVMLDDVGGGKHCQNLTVEAVDGGNGGNGNGNGGVDPTDPEKEIVMTLVVLALLAFYFLKGD